MTSIKTLLITSFLPIIVSACGWVSHEKQLHPGPIILTPEEMTPQFGNPDPKDEWEIYKSTLEENPEQSGSGNALDKSEAPIYGGANPEVEMTLKRAAPNSLEISPDA